MDESSLSEKSPEEKLVDSILEMIDNSNHILLFNNSRFSKIFKEKNLSYDEYILPRSCNIDHEKFSQKKYDFIFLGNILETTTDPQTILKESSHFNTKLVGYVSNFSYVINIGKILDGNFLQEQLLDNTTSFYNLDSLILFLNRCGYSIEKLIRIKKEIDITNPKPLKDFVYNKEILQSILKDPESTTLQYVFTAKPEPIPNSLTKEKLAQFPKNIISESLKESFDSLKHKNLEQESKIHILNGQIKYKQDYIDHIHSLRIIKLLRKFRKKM